MINNNNNLKFELNTPIMTAKGMLVAKLELRQGIECYALYLITGIQNAVKEITTSMSERSIINRLVANTYKLNNQ